MNEWELTDEAELQSAYDSGWDYENALWLSGGGPSINGDVESGREHVAGQRAIATAAQKKLVEWLNERCMEHLHDASIARTERSDCAECWAMIEAALGVKDED